jgi:hypothetical protein
MWTGNIFSLYSCPIASSCTDHVHVPTYLVATKCISYLPSYMTDQLHYYPLTSCLCFPPLESVLRNHPSLSRTAIIPAFLAEGVRE